MYRCRIVWDSLGIVVVPFILWLTTLSEQQLFVLPPTLANLVPNQL